MLCSSAKRQQNALSHYIRKNYKHCKSAHITIASREIIFMLVVIQQMLKYHQQHTVSGMYLFICILQIISK